MFTSRAEYRLQLREDNADLRLTEVAHQMGLVGQAQWRAFQTKQEAVSRETQRLKSLWVNPKNLSVEAAERVLGQKIEREYTLADLLRRPGVDYAALISMDPARLEDPTIQSMSEVLRHQVIEQLEINAKYSGYIERQKDEVLRAEHFENMLLPQDMDFMQIGALSIEVRQKLQQFKPQTLGQASRISGITPAAISLLLIHLKRSRHKGFAPSEESEPVEASVTAST